MSKVHVHFYKRPSLHQETGQVFLYRCLLVFAYYKRWSILGRLCTAWMATGTWAQTALTWVIKWSNILRLPTGTSHLKKPKQIRRTKVSVLWSPRVSFSVVKQLDYRRPCYQHSLPLQTSHHCVVCGSWFADSSTVDLYFAMTCVYVL